MRNQRGVADELDFSGVSRLESAVSVGGTVCNSVLCLALHTLQAPDGHLLATCDVERKQLRQTFNFRILAFLRAVLRSKKSLQ